MLKALEALLQEVKVAAFGAPAVYVVPAQLTE
jgi:hypothetical protein